MAKKDRIQKRSIPFNAENEGTGYSEYTVKRIHDKKLKRNKILLVLLYIAFAAAFCTIFLVLVKMPPVIAVLPLFLWILCFFTWKYTNIEYTYVTCKGEFYIFCVNGYGKGKEVFRRRIEDAEIIAPAGGEYAEKENGNFAQVLDYSSSMNSDNLYFAVYGDTKIYFNVSGVLLSAMKYYSSKNVVLSNVTR